MIKYRKFTADEVKKLIERYERGETLREIGETVDLSRERIRQIFERANYSPRQNTVSDKVLQSIENRRKHLPRHELERLYLVEKKSAREIAPILECSVNIVYINLARYNIPRRTMREINNLNKPQLYPEMNRENLTRWYLEQDKSTIQIAKEVGCARATVFKKLKLLDIRKNKPYKPRQKK